MPQSLKSTPSAAALSRSMFRLSCVPGPRPVMRTCDSTGLCIARPISWPVAAASAGSGRAAILQAEVEAVALPSAEMAGGTRVNTMASDAHQLLLEGIEGDGARGIAAPALAEILERGEGNGGVQAVAVEAVP